MKTLKQKKLINSIAASLLAMFFFVSLIAAIMIAHGFWQHVLRSSDTDNTDGRIRIGEFMADNVLDTDEFNELFERIRINDPFILRRYNHIYILGTALRQNGTYLNGPRVIPHVINQYDVLMWVNGTRIVAAQIVGPPPSNISSWNDLLTDWPRLENALSDPSVALIHYNNAPHSFSHYYITSHAPNSYNGSRWLTRHENNPKPTPQIGDDWFEVHNEFRYQRYPIGYFVSRTVIENGNTVTRYYRKIAMESNNTIAVPGTPEGEDYWEYVPLLGADKMPSWDSRYPYEWAVWNQSPPWTQQPYSVVEHNGEFFVRVNDTSDNAPNINSTDWRRFVRYNPAKVMPILWSNTTTIYQANSFVRHTVAGQERFFIRAATGTGGVPGVSPLWVEVNNWNDASSVRFWSATINYAVTPFGIGTLVRHSVNGEMLLFELYDVTGGLSPGMQPQNRPENWRRILRWSETVSPPIYSIPSSGRPHPAGSFFKWVTGAHVSYFVALQTITGSPEIPNPSDITSNQARRHFRIVERWNPNTRYHSFLTEVGLIQNNLPFRGHAYTIDVMGRMAFWTARRGSGPGAPLAIGARDPLLCDPSDPNRFWDRVEFINTENMVVTEIAGTLRLWQRNPAAPSPIGAPTLANDDWTLLDLDAVSDRFVYTRNYYDTITLWDRGTTAGSTFDIPGHDPIWNRLDYNTGLQFVYTANSANIRTFWFSPFGSTFFPGQGTPTVNPSFEGEVDEWRLVALQMEFDISSILRIESDEVIYFDTSGEHGWVELASATALGTNRAVYHWRNTNPYTNGAIVAYGTTATNMFRFFRLAASEGQVVIGAPPMVDTRWIPIRADEVKAFL